MKHIYDKIVDDIFTSIETNGLEVFINDQLNIVNTNNGNGPSDLDQSESFEIKSEECIELETMIAAIKRFCWLTGFETFVQTTSGYKSEKPGKTMLITISQSQNNNIFKTWISISYQPFSILDYLHKTLTIMEA